MSTPEPHATPALAEADRLMTVCNSCRYCEGLCAVFPAMEMRREFKDGDLNYLTNLCHSCGACYDDCQFSPPHEFNVNVPKVLAEVRNESYAAYAWPRPLAVLFKGNARAVTLIVTASVAALIALFAALGENAGAGLFYQRMSHTMMAVLFGGVSLYVVIAFAMGLRAFWKDVGHTTAPTAASSWWDAIKDAASLRYLDGGKAGCSTAEEQAPDHRRLFHHLTFYGFMLCFAATSVATGYHYLLGREAPYAWHELPVLLGIAGGVGLVIGPIGLLLQKTKRNPALVDQPRKGMDTAFLALLLATSVTGLALFFLRDTAAMNLLLAVHLGIVMGLFLTMPYGKFVHGLYRFAALMRYARERRGLSAH